MGQEILNLRKRPRGLVRQAGWWALDGASGEESWVDSPLLSPPLSLCVCVWGGCLVGVCGGKGVERALYLVYWIKGDIGSCAFQNLDVTLISFLSLRNDSQTHSSAY